MGLFAFGQFTEHEKRGCVGNASRAETVFRLELLLYSFVEDTFTQERGSRRWISAVLLVLLFLFYMFVQYIDIDLHHRIDILSTGYEPSAVTATKNLRSFSRQK